jgi:hypothetical protein
MLDMQVFFKPNEGYHDTFGVAWPMRKDLPKVWSTVLPERTPYVAI